MSGTRAIHNAIRVHYRDKVEKALELPTAYPNGPFTPPDKEAKASNSRPTFWARLVITVDDERQADIGATSVRERAIGLVIVQVFVGQESGTKDIHELVDKIKDEFRRKTVAPVVFRTPRATTIGASEGWFQMNVITPFYSDQVQ